LSKYRSSEKKRDKSTADYEFEKQATECTFKPALLAKSSSKGGGGGDTSSLFGMTTLSDDFNKLPSFGGNISFTKREPAKK